MYYSKIVITPDEYKDSIKLPFFGNTEQGFSRIIHVFGNIKTTLEKRKG